MMTVKRTLLIAAVTLVTVTFYSPLRYLEWTYHIHPAHGTPAMTKTYESWMAPEKVARRAQANASQSQYLADFHPNTEKLDEGLAGWRRLQAWAALNCPASGVPQRCDMDQRRQRQ